MINASELRLGNAVSDGSSIKIVTMIGYKEGVLGAWLNNLYSSDGGQFFAQDDLKPVLLTHEILLSIGLSKHVSTRWYDIQYTTTEDDDDHFITVNLMTSRAGAYSGDKGGIFTGYCLNYLHQLQNLYFALTGTELDVTELLNNQ